MRGYTQDAQGARVRRQRPHLRHRVHDLLQYYGGAVHAALQALILRVVSQRMVQEKKRVRLLHDRNSCRLPDQRQQSFTSRHQAGCASGVQTPADQTQDGKQNDG